MSEDKRGIRGCRRRLCGVWIGSAGRLL